FENRFEGEKHKGVPNESWGKLWDCAWFNFKGKVPAEAAGKKIALMIDISGELFIADDTGNPVRGLTSRASGFDYSLGEPGKTEYPLFDQAVGGEEIDLWADGANNDLFGNYIDNGILKEANISIVSDYAKQLYYDWEVLLELAEQLPEDSARRNRILFTLNRAADGMKHMSEAQMIAAREMLKPELTRKSGGDYPLQISAVGHAHMDLAWLWPVRETIRKIARSFATVIRNMEKYPDYKFGASQAQQYRWLKDYYPKLYAQVKEYVKNGRIELQGGAWTESDGALPSGEAFARQFLYGQKFFREEFGKTVEVAWLPDTFGFTANLPQIFKKSGIKYFVSMRSVVNSRYKSHNSFWWEGRDGTKILTHVIPEGTYNSSAAPRALAGTEKSYMDSGISGNALLVFAIGDGGGGPGEEHLERLEREKDLLGLPPTIQESAENFFKKLEKDSGKFKTWHGEIFFSIFQGTFASQSLNKYYNRKMECILRELEYACVIASVAAKSKYPKEEIDALWEETLLYQFHDILPGSSIERVNAETVDGYKKMLEKAGNMIIGAYADLMVDTVLPAVPLTAVNSMSFDRNEWIRHGGKWANVRVKKLSSAELQIVSDFSDITPSLKADDGTLENDKVCLIFNTDGSIKSIFDKINGRELLSGDGNIFDVYDDYGDGWGILENYRNIKPDRFEFISCETGSDGPTVLRKSKYKYMSSVLEQTIVLTHGSKRIDFFTTINMQDKHKMVRTSFPVGIKTNEAVCDIQYGSVKRALHENTLLDSDKWEVYAHKYIDLSDKNYGVAMLNDGKYGHYIHNANLDLDLARTTTHPGDNGDIGEMSFVYSVFPHSGDWTNGVIREAYKLNTPMFVCNGKLKEEIKPIIDIDAENIIVEAVKQSEDGTGIIIRLCEAYGAETRAQIKFGLKNSEIVNILEDSYCNKCYDKQTGILTFKPFEVHTIKLT
ncbi:MAG: glycosyl hydrolase-related protein, partial [Oscillospiraceae bacterium]|nr:glycosyl hydrolase-related protein [Oscillospiraceae bacterium]